MRVAIIHDDCTITGGGEKLISILAKGLLNKGIMVDIYTFNISADTKKIIFKDVKVNTLKEKKILSQDDTVKRYSFSKLNLKKYDLYIFSGNLSICAAKNHKPNILYCHNLPKKEKLKVIPRIRSKYLALSELFLFYHDIKLFKFSIYQQTFRNNLNEITKIIVNSKNTKNKLIKKFKRHSKVIYPPIETNLYKKNKSKNYWISINRITPLKRIELQLMAFSKLPNESLYIIGAVEDHSYYKKLQKIKPYNVKFLGTLKDKELINIIGQCKGLIFTGKDEDFGMAPIEALASGKPVIAPSEGGLQETLVHNKTGYLLRNINSNNIIKAIKKMSKILSQTPDHFEKYCKQRAKLFDDTIFINSMKNEIITK